MPEVLIKYRIHENQGAIKYNELAKKEDDDLHVWFLRNLSREELNCLSSGSKGLFYSELALFFLKRHLSKAANLAFINALIYFFPNSLKSLRQYIYNNILYMKRRYLRA